MNNESTWKITPEKKFIKNDTLNLLVADWDLNDSGWKHKFKNWQLKYQKAIELNIENKNAKVMLERIQKETVANN
ncbi:hypothetical protein [Flavobacterium sp. SM2513]|uniref:hypothetical protein n=1 Tax=Flavobacterium sp. SM2513 TaxID=3424766 RepID=UPI003D7F36E5